jgi:hypothetical protein
VFRSSSDRDSVYVQLDRFCQVGVVDIGVGDVLTDDLVVFRSTRCSIPAHDGSEHVLVMSWSEKTSWGERYIGSYGQHCDILVSLRSHNRIAGSRERE